MNSNTEIAEPISIRQCTLPTLFLGLSMLSHSQSPNGMLSEKNVISSTLSAEVCHDERNLNGSLS